MNAKETAKIRKSINRELAALPTFHAEIPVSKIQNVMVKHGLLMVNEDGTEFDSLFCGEQGDSFINVQGAIVPTMNIRMRLHLSWYTMPSGNYEITVFVS